MVQVQHKAYATILTNLATCQQVVLRGPDGAWIDETTKQEELEEFFGEPQEDFS